MAQDLIIRGPPFWSKIPEVSLGKQIYESLINCKKEEVAYVDDLTGEQLLYKDFFRLSCELANSLRNCGYKLNDVIGICSPNANNFFIPVVSALYLGMVTTTINYSYTERELLQIANIAKPKVIFCSQSVLPHFTKLRNVASYIERLIILDSNDKSTGYDTIHEFIKKHKDNDFKVENFVPVEVDPFVHLAVILYSSGTTGLPKGVMTTHDNISARINHINDPRVSTRTDVILGLLPFFHGYGFMINLGAIIQRRKIIVMKKFDGEIFLRYVEKYSINTLNLVPPIMLFLSRTPLLHKYDLSSVQEITCGAAPLSADIEAIIKRRLPNVKSIRQAYGLTESTLAVTGPPVNQSKTGSCGKVMPGIQCIVRDPENGVRLGPNQIGELCFKGRLITKGYYGNIEATRKTYSSDGWLFTGDLGYYDEEHYFYIVDRLKELIKYKGFQVAPAELEALILQYPGVRDVGVIGKPDDEAGELPLAFVVKEVNSNVTERQIKDFVASQVSHIKQLRGGVKFIDEIPRNPSGKILRRQLRELLLKQSSKL